MIRRRPILLLLCALAPFAACAQSPPVSISIVGDMEKPIGNERIADSPFFLDRGTITLHGARNEVVAFQVILHAVRTVAGLDVRVGDLTGPATLATDLNVQIYLAHYVASADASYSWGPRGGAGALPWRERLWPDALIPFNDPYDPAHPPVATPFAIDPARHRTQSVWIDILIPQDSLPGTYRGELEVLRDGAPFATYPIQLRVHPFALPAENHIDAYGELYRETGVMFDSGVKFKLEPDRDWPVYRRYLQMAHAHRFLATHRADGGPRPRTASGAPADQPTNYWSEDWSLYTPYVAPVLDGSLFTVAEGYVGPSPGAPPSFFPAPFLEAFYGRQLVDHLAAHDGKLDPAFLDALDHNARAFWREVEHRGWQDVRWFAYIFDEVHGFVDQGETAAAGEIPVAGVHAAMREVQATLDRATSGPRIALLWTSHSDPSRWNDTSADLRPFIRGWAPNGHALNPAFFAALPPDPHRRVWFYHSGQPAVGNHTINQLGVDLRLWGLLCRRYPQVQGSFWWSMMNFAYRYDDRNFNPFDRPVYKRDETRWGNGVLFYPGSRLTQIGFPRNIAGPLSSLRMKAYRRGLQDYEYCRLADQAGQSAEVDALLNKLIPAAFTEAPARAVPGLWSHDPADYYRLRQQLAELIESADDITIQ
jgi:hypothetical protein